MTTSRLFHREISSIFMIWKSIFTKLARSIVGGGIGGGGGGSSTDRERDACAVCCHGDRTSPRGCLAYWSSSLHAKNMWKAPRTDTAIAGNSFVLLTSTTPAFLLVTVLVSGCKMECVISELAEKSLGIHLISVIGKKILWIKILWIQIL